MKFRDIRPYLEGEVKDWVKKELNGFLRQIRHGLTKLSFADNFDSFEATVTFPSGGEQAIPNKLPFIPAKFILASSNYGIAVRGTTTWTADTLYLAGDGVNTDTVTVIFLR